MKASRWLHDARLPWAFEWFADCWTKEESSPAAGDFRVLGGRWIVDSSGSEAWRIKMSASQDEIQRYPAAGLSRRVGGAKPVKAATW